MAFLSTRAGAKRHPDAASMRRKRAERAACFVEAALTSLIVATTTTCEKPNERAPEAPMPSGVAVSRRDGGGPPRGNPATASLEHGAAARAGTADAREAPRAYVADGGETPRVIRFPWTPPGANTEAYAMGEVEDQHRIVLPPSAVAKVALPVLVAFHGQPKRGQAPRSYNFAQKVLDTTSRVVAEGAARPVAIVLPVFRYFGQNWPQFDLVAFRGEIDRRLADAGVTAEGYYVIGHSGAAGCGGDGMNRVHRMNPAAVGFFDTCLGPAWRDEVQRLRSARVPTLLVHSVETAAFSPRQPTEYMSTFDFGRAYGPAGLAPSECPLLLPAAPLREQPFRCSADRDGVTRGFIVDSGEGEEGHNAMVPIALEYFLKSHLGPRAR